MNNEIVSVGYLQGLRANRASRHGTNNDQQRRFCIILPPGFF
jgi:hypothetical protein